MRILLLNQFFPPDTAATGQLLADVAAELNRRGHEVHVVCSRRSYGGGGEVYPAEEFSCGASVHRLEAAGFGRRFRIGRIVDYLSFYYLAARRVLQLPRMDVCLCLTTPPFVSLLGAGLARRRRTALVCWTMDLYPEIAVALDVLRGRGLFHRMLKRVAAGIYRSSKAIIALGDVMARALAAAGADPDRISVVHNWVPSDAIQPADLPDQGSFTIMYSGNLGMGHQLDTLLHGVAGLDRPSDISVMFVGGGKMKTTLERMSGELGLDCVRFAPPCPLAELSQSMAQASVHVVSQRPGTEGLIVPSKIYGILASGRPALYIGPGDTEVARIIRDSECGILVEAGDVKGVTAALEKLRSDRQQLVRMADRARLGYSRLSGMAESTAAIAEIVESAAPDAAMVS
jgi:glycosyltransferase involved in cell wall biosynthesis